MYPTLYHFFLSTFDLKIEFLKNIYTLGFLMAVAWIVASYIFVKKSSTTTNQSLSIIAIALFASLLGSELLALLESGDSYHNHSGLTYYGGLILASLMIVIFLKWRKIQIKPVLDSAIIPLIIGYGIGRLGCHFSGDGDWGIVNHYGESNWLPNWLWSYNYPGNVLGIYNTADIEIISNSIYEHEYSFQLKNPVYPTSVYEFILSIIGALFLMFLSLKSKLNSGNLFFFGIIYFAGCRFLIEFIRDTSTNNLGIPLSNAQLISLGILSMSCIGFLRNRKQKQES